MLEKAAFGAPFPPTVSRIEVKVLGGWMTWAETSISTGGSSSGKVIFLGWNDLKWCSRELHEGIWPADSRMWAVIKMPVCGDIPYRGMASWEGTFLPCLDEELFGELGLRTSGHWKQRDDKEGKGTFLNSQEDHSPEPGRKLPHS